MTNSKTMEPDLILEKLSEIKPKLLEKYGVTNLGIFGSLARNEATDTSDIDIVVKMPPDLFMMVHLKNELQEILQTPVDLVRYHQTLNPFLKARIDQEAIYV